MRIYDISKELLSVAASPPVPQTFLSKVYDLDRGDLCNESVLHACVHIGTHCDAYSHFVPGGDDIARLPLEHYVGKCQVLRVPEKTKLRAADLEGKLAPETPRLLLHGGGGTYLSPEAAKFLADCGISTVGTDAWSVADAGEEAAVHLALLGQGVAVIEDLFLDEVPDGIYFLAAAPIKIAGSDGAHCRALLLSDL